MKRIGVLLICFLTLSQSTSPKWNCLDDSRHLKESYDTKAYAPPVGGCTCECDQEQARGLHSPNRDKCIQCDHYHDPEPQYFVSAQTPKSSRGNQIMARHPLATLRALIAKYRQKEQSHHVCTGTNS